MNIAAAIVCSFLFIGDVLAFDYFRKKYSDAYRTTPELIEEYGHTAETHYVTTEDGYILTVHRIPADSNSPNYKGTIIVMHGLAASSAAWTISGPDVSFGFLLSSRGYDVWLPNLRGNFYSRSHTTLSKDDPEFWNFSWHESGMYDVPAVIDYVLGQSECNTTIYIGHSMGTTVSYVALSKKPEYNDKIRVLVSLSPVAQLSHSTSFFKPMGQLVALLREPLKALGIGELLQQEIPSTDIRVVTCSLESPATNELCKFIRFYSTGTPEERLNETNIPNIAGHYTAGTSRDMIAHFGQGMTTGRFAEFDYGPVDNMKIYNNIQPPLYPVEKVVVPTYFYHGESDTLGTPTDVNIIASQLGNVKEVNPIPDFAHNDMNFAKDADTLAYNKVIEMLEQYPCN